MTLNENQYKKTSIKKIDYLIGVYFPKDLYHAEIRGYGFIKDFVRDHSRDFTYNGVTKKMYSLPADKLHKFKIDSINVI